MIYLRLSVYLVGAITMIVALAKDAPFSTFGGSLAAMFVVFFLQVLLPGPTAGWTSPSGVIRFPGQPAPDWSVAVRGLACLVALVYEVQLLQLAWMGAA